MREELELEKKNAILFDFFGPSMRIIVKCLKSQEEKDKVEEEEEEEKLLVPSSPPSPRCAQTTPWKICFDFAFLLEKNGQTLSTFSCQPLEWRLALAIFGGEFPS